MKFCVRYARIVYFETIVEAQSENEIRDDGSLPSVYTRVPLRMIPPAVDRIEVDDRCWEVKPACEQMPEKRVGRTGGPTGANRH
jgi:hypothetical protein